jgi:hypothetical protein
MLKTVAALAALAIAAPALADPFPGGGEPHCGDPGQPACPKPDLPNEKPTVVGGFGYGNFNDSTQVSGYMSSFQDQPFAVIDPFWALHSDQVHHVLDTNTVTLGTAASGVNFAVNAAGPSELYSITLGGQRSGTTGGAVSNGMSVSYVIKLTAADSTEAAKLAAIIDAGAHARAMGKYELALAGQGYSTVSAVTGQFTYAAQDSFQAKCLDDGNFFDVSGCGTHNYEIAVNFVRGDTFAGGSALDYYGDVTISGFLISSNPSFAGSAYIDPVIAFGTPFHGINFTAQGGSTPLAISFVPEPAQWTLMIGGFGFAGAAARRRRVRAIA